MRNGGTFNSTSAVQQKSPWHSPVPYLFGGLAAMLGLIAFALLILACSYWKLSGDFDGGDRDVESGAGRGDGEKAGGGTGKAEPPVFEEKIVVIMAGDDRPTFLAKPLSARAAFSLGDEGESETEKEEKGNEKKPKPELGRDVHDQAASTTTTTAENYMETQHTQVQNQ
ncbi:protein GLUTAMINE DUMPER 5-like [Malania oleifera]|uniref:protein GLUTAMINE DUMPER 5-like n=1 Tax=Malania oleifera TaxID=397392 RepID=UPI0025AEA3E3|nr:protein GLUTAMINE DUMPER 5-like [Malania oleifera]